MSDLALRCCLSVCGCSHVCSVT